MHIGRHIVQELVLSFGQPEILRWEVPLTAPEMDEVERHLALGRAHDVSLVILDGERLVVVRKPGYPPGAYRIPSGGIHPEESFVDGARREALEETGLTVAIVDYLLQVHATFTCADRVSKWTTHVMLARREDGELGPRDGREIEAARYIDWAELIEKVNPILLDSGLGGLAYRARLHEGLRALVPTPGRIGP